MKKIIVLVVFLFASTELYSQNLEDGLRMTRRENGVSARSNALGMSFRGINDDGTALYFNPAGLFLVPTSEIQAGMSVKYLKSNIDYLGNDFTNDRSSQYLSNLSFAAPIGEGSNKITFGLGYFRDYSHNDLFNFSALNQNGSMIKTLSTDGDWVVSDLRLADFNNPTITPIDDSLQQNYSMRQNGNSSRFIVGLAFSIGEKASIGASYSLYSSNYSSFKKLDEIDVFNKYNNYDEENWSDVDFRELYHDLNISQNMVGHSGNIGIMVTPTEKSRLFASVDFPTVYNYEEDWSYMYESFFDNRPGYLVEDEGEFSYRVITPFRFNFGASYNILGITFSGAMTYVDATNLKFDESNETQVLSREDLNLYNDINTSIDERLASAKIDWGIGAEYKFLLFPMFLRASYSSYNTPYREGWRDLSTIKTLAVGAGFLVNKHIMLDVSLSNSDYDETSFLYQNQSFNNVRDLTNVIVGFSYRFD